MSCYSCKEEAHSEPIRSRLNVTRKLMQEGKRPLSVGIFFFLDHSTIVVIASLVVYLSATVVATQLDVVKSVSGIVGTSISASFLIAIALVNTVILRGVWQTFRQVRKGGGYTDQGPDILLGGGGTMARIFRPLLRMISRPWHMYPIGVLFGLGFDTATEVALLGISAAAAARGLPVVAMAVFPVLFTAE